MNDNVSQIHKKQVHTDFLQELVQSNTAVYGALISSTDGHTIDFLFEVELSDSRLAAMTSSCLALSERLAQESQQAGCDFVILQNGNGYLAIKRITQELVVTVMAKDSATLGILLSGLKLAVAKYSEQF